MNQKTSTSTSGQGASVHVKQSSTSSQGTTVHVKQSSASGQGESVHVKQSSTSNQGTIVHVPKKVSPGSYLYHLRRRYGHSTFVDDLDKEQAPIVPVKQAPIVPVKELGLDETWQRCKLPDCTQTVHRSFYLYDGKIKALILIQNHWQLFSVFITILCNLTTHSLFCSGYCRRHWRESLDQDDDKGATSAAAVVAKAKAPDVAAPDVAAPEVVAAADEASPVVAKAKSPEVVAAADEASPVVAKAKAPVVAKADEASPIVAPITAQPSAAATASIPKPKGRRKSGVVVGGHSKHTKPPSNEEEKVNNCKQRTKQQNSMKNRFVPPTPVSKLAKRWTPPPKEPTQEQRAKFSSRFTPREKLVQKGERAPRVTNGNDKGKTTPSPKASIVGDEHKNTKLPSNEKEELDDDVVEIGDDGVIDLTNQLD